MGNPRRIAVGIVLSLLAGGGSPGGGSVSAQPLAPAQLVDKDLWRTASLTSIPRRKGVEAVHAGKGRPDIFQVEYALIELKAGQALPDLLKQSGHQALYATASGQPALLSAPAPNVPRSYLRRPPTRTTFVPVKLQPGLVSPLESAILVSRKFGGGVRFSSEQALLAMGEILKYNLVPDFVMKPTQLVTRSNVKEDPDALNSWPITDGYWPLQDLWRAWQLAQVAAPKTPLDVWVAVVDQGFWDPNHDSRPPGLTWDRARFTDSGIGDAGDDKNRAWHGTNCASALNASVRDATGAAGSALFGTASNVAPLVPRNVRTMAVEIPAGYGGSYYWIGRSIKDAVQQGAQIVSVSYSGDCNGVCSETYSSSPDREIVEALNDARAASTLVLFSAGNDNVNMDDPNRQIIGCETPGAICVGGLERDGRRWVSEDRAPDGTYYGSNYGKAVTLWGPAHWVWVNPDQRNAVTHHLDGTSFAAPFMAGILALVESASGQLLSTDTVLQKLKSPGILGPGKDPSGRATTQPSILNAYALARLFAHPARDAFEGRTAFPTPLDLLTLDTPSDSDSYEIATNGCEELVATVDYLKDETLGKFHVTLRTSGAVPQVVEAVPFEDALVAQATACKGKHQLQITQDKQLTTGYSVSLIRQPFACDASCKPSKGGSGIDKLIIPSTPPTSTSVGSPPVTPPDPCVSPNGKKKKDCPGSDRGTRGPAEDGKSE